MVLGRKKYLKKLLWLLSDTYLKEINSLKWRRKKTIKNRVLIMLIAVFRSAGGRGGSHPMRP
jgi:hypothetical protein